MANKLALLLLAVLMYVTIQPSHARSAPQIQRSHSVDSALEVNPNGNNPGWMKRKLIRLGEIASKLDSGLGGPGSKAAAFVERLCTVLKKIVPVVATVCRFKQFQFCSSLPDEPKTTPSTDAFNERHREIFNPFK